MRIQQYAKTVTERPWIAAALFFAGLYATFKSVAHLIYEAEGYEAGAADCDDCDLTILLDNIGWLALVVVAYIVLAVVLWVTVRRVARRPEAT